MYQQRLVQRDPHEGPVGDIRVSCCVFSISAKPVSEIDASKFCGHYIDLTICMAYLMRAHGTGTLKMSPWIGTDQPTSMD